jgi:hypothetical protein
VSLIPVTRNRVLFAPLVALTLLCSAARAADDLAAKPAAGEATKFIRFTEDGKGGGTLDAAVVTYRDKRGRQVDLLSALHVGEKAYYDELSKTFKQYDALLYEMVKPKGMGAPVQGQRTGSAVSGFQRFLKHVLDLEFQLDAVDYSPKNFVHADLDYETFAQKQEERGESMFSLMLRSMLAEMNRQAAGQGGRPITLIDILVAMNSPDSARQYKLLLAHQFENIEAQLAGMEGPDGSVLLTERNKAALKVLDEQLGAGRKNVGVFYGAGHMTGLEQALTTEMGFERTGVRWIVAWDMTQAAADAEVAKKKKAAAEKAAAAKAKAAPQRREREKPAGEPVQVK